MNVEDRVRRSLEQQAERFEPTADHVEEALARARRGEPAPAPEGPPARRAVLIVAAFALFIVAAVPLWAAFRDAGVSPPAASSPPPSPSVDPASVSPCDAGQLSVRMIPTDGAAGNVLTPVELVNTSSEACSLGGYPSLRFLGRDGQDLGLHASHDPQDEGQIPPSPIPRTPFVVEPGDTASFRLYSTDVIPPCASAAEIVITPPGGTGTVTVHADATHRLIFCTGVLSVTAATLSRLPH
jgi:hypothetical protein